jgi:DNA repair protein RecO (recombination protein O)
MEPFVVNDLLLANGRWSSAQDPHAQLQRIAQADTVQSFPKLCHSLAKLTAAQYLAEVTLIQALSGHSQEELFVLLLEHLQRLETAATDHDVLPLLVHGLFHLMALGGIAPHVQSCHYCRRPMPSASDPEIYFSLTVGGIVCEPCAMAQRPKQISVISSMVLRVMQSLPAPLLPSRLPLASQPTPDTPALPAWLGAEAWLRRAFEYHSEHEIRSASLMDCSWSLAQD